MFVIPSVDIMDGKCVKLVHGQPGTGLKLSRDPVDMAEIWESEGAKILHVVDLDAAIYGTKRNRKIVEKILHNLRIQVEVGGGIRSKGDAVSLIDAGARWVILGTAAIENPQLPYETAEAVSSDRIIIALDSRRNVVVSKGWTKETPHSPEKIAKLFEPLKSAAFLFTDVDVEGTLEGVGLEAVRKLAASTRIPILYSGGISSIQDILKLKPFGVKGVIVGRALYEQRFTLREAMGMVENEKS